VANWPSGGCSASGREVVREDSSLGGPASQGIEVFWELHIELESDLD